MNTPIFTFAKNCIKVAVFVAASTVVIAPVKNARADWKVDFSRRTRAIREADLNAAAYPATNAQPSERQPASQTAPGPVAAPIVEEKEVNKGVFDTIFDSGEPVQDLVILQTEKGFVPSIVRVRKNGRYRVHVVNVNEKEKNVSFILDGFSEHHATYYGKIKTFSLEPKKEGQFSFQSPETSSEGKLIVFNPQATLRAPAAVEESAR